MHRYQALLMLVLLTTSVWPADFSGQRALAFTRKAVSFGPRPSGSAAIKKLQAYIVAELQSCRCQVRQDEFQAHTPVGIVRMKNIIAQFAGSSSRAVAISGHYDTKSMPGIEFAGANDGGSSTGVLLELAKVLTGATLKQDVYLVWFDGEEAFGEWSATNGIYGSRHLADRWSADGTLSKITALINIDMIGDKDLGIVQEYNSTPWLRKLVWDAAERIGYGRYFLTQGNAIEDDHVPFLRKGVAALDLIDFDYGPRGSYWHTAQDTMDKISAHSLEVVGSVLQEVLKEL